jgi:K+-transporting ATPase ATPase A chain
LRTDTWSFGWVYLFVVLIVGALTFFPALSLGPIAEHLVMAGGAGR